MSVDQPVPEPKTKTKAKQRYLKAKKDRRKKRRVQSKEQQKLAKKEDEKDPSDASSSESDASEGEKIEVEVPAPPKERKDGKPDKKRKKLEHEPEPEPDAMDVDPPAAPPIPLNHDPTPSEPLPSFPLPVQPNAPSKSTLALQGLDKALLDAEIIDPARVLPIDALTRPDGQVPILSEKMRARLQELGITEFFAVQTALLPFLLPPEPELRALYCSSRPLHDVCVSAPTGSGKTLAYVIPIVETLSVRIVTRLRALIVLPTRDLVLQVQETFEAFCKGRGLKIGVITGQHSFAHEQRQLIADPDVPLQGGSSKIDILICTPGRLIDHLESTPNFTLQHLRFLVIDEADRLLAQSFQDWLAQVLNATRPPPKSLIPPSWQSISDSLLNLNLNIAAPQNITSDPPHLHPIPPPLLLTHDALSPSYLHTSLSAPHIPTEFDGHVFTSCQKLLFSATLTRDPSKIAAMKLRRPRYFVVQDVTATIAPEINHNLNTMSTTTDTPHDADPPSQAHLLLATSTYAMPPTLTEHLLVCSPARKPLMLFHLIHNLGVRNALVFTKSAESTGRLVRLVEFFEEGWVAAAAGKGKDGNGGEERKAVSVRMYSSDLGRQERKVILDEFKEQKIDILICSDLISRGIDIPTVPHVISYDAPTDLRKYVHRVGRTARAGRSGDAWTLVEEQEARYFKGMFEEVGRLGRLKRVRVGKGKKGEGKKGEGVGEEMERCYEAALEKLKSVYSRSYE